jgi:hypothetical protein
VLEEIGIRLLEWGFGEKTNEFKGESKQTEINQNKPKYLIFNLVSE